MDPRIQIRLSCLMCAAQILQGRSDVTDPDEAAAKAVNQRACSATIGLARAFEEFVYNAPKEVKMTGLATASAMAMPNIMPGNAN